MNIGREHCRGLCRRAWHGMRLLRRFDRCNGIIGSGGRHYSFLRSLGIHMSPRMEPPFITCVRKVNCGSAASAEESGNVANKKVKLTKDDAVFLGAKKCPACMQTLYRKHVFRRHIERCCPDLLIRVPQEGALDVLDFVLESEEILDGWLVRAREEECRLHERSLEIGFRQRDEFGSPIRQGPEEIKSDIGLVDLPRAERILKAAMKGIPIPADKDPIEVLYEDECILGLNKPPFVITAPKHRFEGGSLVNRVLGNTGKMPFVVHRLDMNTSGVLLFAKTSKMASLLHEQFRNKVPQKTYLAIVIGTPEWEETLVDAPIGQSPIEKVARMVTEDGKQAMTKFKVIKSSVNIDISGYMPGVCMDQKTKDYVKSGISSCSLMECMPLTGRTHQIRVHLAHLGHPIVGDDLYGITGPCINRHALHAAKLVLKHPETREELCVEAPLPEDFASAARSLHL